MKTKNTRNYLRKYFSILDWRAQYTSQTLVNDLLTSTGHWKRKEQKNLEPNQVYKGGSYESFKL